VRDGATGLTYMQARHYDPELGRFLSNDPIGVSLGTPQSFNRYAYANNNPYRYVDPDGRIPIPLIIAAIGGAVTVYETYQTYRNEGAAAAGKSAAIGAALTVSGAGGAKLAGSLGKRIGSFLDRMTSSRGTDAPAGGSSKSDFVVSRDGAVVPNSPEGARRSLDGAGHEGDPITNTAGTETGTLHNVPDMRMDVRVMDGGPHHSARVTTAREGTSQPVNPSSGSNFGNVSRTEQRERSHIEFTD